MIDPAILVAGRFPPVLDQLLPQIIGVSAVTIRPWAR
jgi:hypothetical protein